MGQQGIQFKESIVFLCLFFWSISYGQTDSNVLRSIFDEALLRGKSYEDLRSLCKDVGPRLSGSSEASMAVRWSEQKMNASLRNSYHVKGPHQRCCGAH